MQNTFSDAQINYWYFDKVGNVSSDLSEGVYQIKNANTNKYIEVQNGGTTNSTKIIQAIKSDKQLSKILCKTYRKQ